MTRGLLELIELSVAMGVTPHTLTGLAGMADLMVTCASPLCRNHPLPRHRGALHEHHRVTRRAATQLGSDLADVSVAAFFAHF